MLLSYEKKKEKLLLIFCANLDNAFCEYTLGVGGNASLGSINMTLLNRNFVLSVKCIS